MTKSSQAAVRYARAFINLLEEEYECRDEGIPYADINEILSEVRIFWNQNKTLKGFILHPRIVKEQKKKVADKLFESPPFPLAADLFKLLIEKGRTEFFTQVLDHVIKLLRKKEGIYRVKLITAVKFNDSERSKLKNNLTSFVPGANSIELNEEIDPDLLGGFILKYNNILLDFSLKKQLLDINKKLKKAEIELSGVEADGAEDR